MPVYNEAQLSSYVDQIFARLQRIEDHLAISSPASAEPFVPASASAPDDVVALARAGDRIGAIKRYREITGCGLEEARTVVAGL